MELVYRIDGLEATDRAFATYPRRVQERLEEVTAEYAFLIQREAQLLAPVDTGFLRNNIVAEQVSPAGWEIRAMANYAGFVERGTRLTPAQPFLVPAALRYKQDYVRACRRAVSSAWPG